MKKTAGDGFCSPMKKLMLAVLAAGLIGCAGFGALYGNTGAGWALSAAVTCGMFAYHMLIRFAAPGILTAFSHKKYNYESWWFRRRPWEDGLYRFLKVKKWKGKALTYDPREFSLELHSLEEIVNNMCHAELTHEIIIVLSFTSLLFAVPFGSFAAFCVTAAAAALFDSSFVVIQRYNRPRLIRLMNRRKKAPADT